VPPPPFSISATVDQPNVTSFNCPVTFTFTATVTYTGSATGTFPYTWLRSDGAIDTLPTSVSFEGPGSQRVQTTWTLSSNTNQTFSGWEQLQLTAGSGVLVLSNRANFSLTCRIIP
jgi:hypothetical protein